MKPELNKHGWSGEYEPGKTTFSSITFSVGIFKWVQARKGLKKSAVIYRVKGYSSNPQAVYDRADDICFLMDIGGWHRTEKSEFVK